MQRAASGDRRWSLTLYPTAAYAQDAEMATDEFARFLESACMLDRPDPVASWQSLSDRQARMIDWLSPRGEIHMTAPGTDLRQAFAQGLASLERDGWHSEGASGGMVFVRRGAERRLLSVYEHDPQEPLPPGHAVLAGRCATCE